MLQEFPTVSLDFTKAVIQSMHNKELEEFVTTQSLMTCLQMIYIYIELYKSESASEAFTLVWTINFCIPDVKVWIVQNKLQLNDDKTEILLTGSAPGIGCLPWCYFKTILELLPLASGKL